MKIAFTKVESLQNDFVIVHATARSPKWSARQAASICDRRLGVGADGLILLGPAGPDGIPFRLYNADGSSAEWSGNGVRGAAAHLAARYPRKSEFHFLTRAGCVRVNVRRSRQGIAASFTRPMPAMTVPSPRSAREALALAGRVVTNGPVFVDAGNPHWVFTVTSFDFDWQRVGASCQSSNVPTRGINVEFVRVVSPRRLELRLYERGVGPTPSSGTGALAAMAACNAMKLVDNAVALTSPGGAQTARVNRAGDAITLAAPARVVMSGVWNDGQGRGKR